jgi:hypothetical protein
VQELSPHDRPTAAIVTSHAKDPPDFFFFFDFFFTFFSNLPACHHSDAGSTGMGWMLRAVPRSVDVAMRDDVPSPCRFRECGKKGRGCVGTWESG